jgi:hypothetical protein
MAISRSARTPKTLPHKTGHGVTGFGRQDGDMTSPTSPATHDRIDPRPVRAAPTLSSGTFVA